MPVIILLIAGFSANAQTVVTKEMFVKRFEKLADSFGKKEFTYIKARFPSGMSTDILDNTLVHPSIGDEVIACTSYTSDQENGPFSFVWGVNLEDDKVPDNITVGALTVKFYKVMIVGFPRKP